MESPEEIDEKHWKIKQKNISEFEKKEFDNSFLYWKFDYKWKYQPLYQKCVSENIFYVPRYWQKT